MSARSVLALGSLFSLTALATTVHAQAPGQWTPEVAPAPSAPGMSDPCSYDRPSVMTRRWAIGLNLGVLSVVPDSADPDDSNADTNFRTSELSIRYRATRHLELELALTGGRQVLDDDSDGELAMGGGTLGARYRFRPERAWNWWLMGGLGGTVIERHNSSEEAREGAMRPHVAFGIGIERRFRRFALQAEARMLAIGPRSDSMEDVPVRDLPGGMPLPPDSINSAGDEDLTGGTFTFGASFYF